MRYSIYLNRPWYTYPYHHTDDLDYAHGIANSLRALSEQHGTETRVEIYDNEKRVRIA